MEPVMGDVLLLTRNNYTAGALAIILVAALLSGAVTQMVKDIEDRLRGDKPPSAVSYTRLRAVSVGVGMAGGWLALEVIASIPDPAGASAYVGPGTLATLFFGALGGLFTTSINAWIKGHFEGWRPRMHPAPAQPPPVKGADVPPPGLTGGGAVEEDEI